MKKTVVESKLAKDLVADPSNPPDLVHLSGYFGKSTEAGSIRIYDDESDLRRFVEVKEADIVRVEPSLANPDLSAVWLSADANVRVVRVVMASQLRKRLTLRTEIIRHLSSSLTPDRLPLPVSSTVGMCTSCNSCSLEPCC